MKSMIFVSSLLGSVLVGILALPARADECNKQTYLTFSEPVALPGVTLPAGTYQFTHPDCSTTDQLLRVSSEDGSKVYATVLTVPKDRATPSDQPTVVFAEMPAGAPEAIKAWFYPGETVGQELIYPRNEERKIVGALDRTVVATNGVL